MPFDPQFVVDFIAQIAIFLLIGFLAQMIDGALGMAYGVISSTSLLSIGIPPAQASMMIHVAECVTTAASGASHIAHKNVDWPLFWRLAPAGIVGGVLGAYVITGFDQTLVKTIVVAYLAILGVLIFKRAFREPPERPPQLKNAIPLGFTAGFLDASGGGGWGPVAASTLMGRGHTPRYVIGTVNTSEFFITAAISAAFVFAVFTGRLNVAGGVEQLLAPLAGLLIGGVLAAPLAGRVTKVVPARVLFGAVGLLVVALSVWQGIALWPALLADPLTARLTALLVS
ncbi:MAG: sulfite exporter TauE/SafE family protein [Hyphomonadaceae bacterium]|nr:sulfite exporter TauE/SafE family protein [Hyphomonadaceae bacterium]